MSVSNTQLARCCDSLLTYGLLFCRWGVLFSHPADFTPVCTTELGEVAKLIPEFTKRNTKVIAISCDPVDKHKAWIEDIKVREPLNRLLACCVAHSLCNLCRHTARPTNLPTRLFPTPLARLPFSWEWWTLWRKIRQAYLSPAEL